MAQRKRARLGPRGGGFDSRHSDVEQQKPDINQHFNAAARLADQHLNAAARRTLWHTLILTIPLAVIVILNKVAGLPLFPGLTAGLALIVAVLAWNTIALKRAGEADRAAVREAGERDRARIRAEGAAARSEILRGFGP